MSLRGRGEKGAVGSNKDRAFREAGYKSRLDSVTINAKA